MVATVSVQQKARARMERAQKRHFERTGETPDQLVNRIFSNRVQRVEHEVTYDRTPRERHLATDKQKSFIESLLKERSAEATKHVRETFLDKAMSQLDKQTASEAITALLAIPRSPSTPSESARVPAGKYVLKDSSVVYKVSHGKGRWSGWTFVEADGVSVKEPERGAILRQVAEGALAASQRYGQQTGMCGCCGAELTNPESIAAGIGPICASRY